MPEIDRELDELERQLADMTGGDSAPPAPEPEPAPVEAAAPAEEAAPEEAEPVETEPEPSQPDWRALAEQRAKELEDAHKHAARLAGEIGYLKSRGKASAGDAFPEDDASVSDDYSGVDPIIADELETLRLQREEDQRRIERLENEYDINLHEKVLQAESLRIEERIGWRPEDDPVAGAAIARHAELLADLKSETDPSLLKAGARFVVESVAADILAARNSRMTAQKTASTHANHRAKVSAGISGSGGAAPLPTRPHTTADMTATEADTWLRENVR